MKKKIILVGLISIFGLTISKTAYAKAILTDPYNDACNYVDGKYKLLDAYKSPNYVYFD